MTTFRHRQARTLLFVAACASIVACQSADIANFNSPNTSQLEGSPNAATVNTTVAGVLAGSRAGAGTWASTIGTIAPSADHPGAAAVSVIERPTLGGLANCGRTPHLRRTVIAFAAIGRPGRAVK